MPRLRFRVDSSAAPRLRLAAWTHVPRLMRSLPALYPAQAAEIAALVRPLAARLGYAADLEGAIAGGRVVLFQARPITTLDGLALAAD